MNSKPEGAVPTIEGEPRNQSTRRSVGPVALLAATALALSVVNLTSAMYLFRAKSDLAELDARLDELAAFERRLNRKIDSVNNGLQNQFDQLNLSLQGQFYDITDRLDRQDCALKSTAELSASTSAFPPLSPPVSAGPSNEPMTSSAEDLPKASVPVQPAAPPPRANLSYQRLESADGKVYYKRIR